MQFDAVKSGLLGLQGCAGIGLDDAGNLLQGQLPGLLAHGVEITAAGHRRNTEKGADALGARMGDLGNHLAAVGVDGLGEPGEGGDALFASETEGIAQIGHPGVDAEGVQNDTAHPAFGPGLPVILHGLVDAAVLAFVSQGHGSHKGSVFQGHGPNAQLLKQSGHFLTLLTVCGLRRSLRPRRPGPGAPVWRLPPWCRGCPARRRPAPGECSPWGGNPPPPPHCGREW